MSTRKLTRRRFATASLSLIGGGLAAPAIMSRALAQSPGLTVMISGGLFADGNTEAYVKPFEAATGIKVNAVRQQMDLPKMKLKVESNNVDFDACYVSAQAGAIAARNGYLQDLDYSLYDPKDLAGIAKSGQRPWGIGSFYYAFVLCVNRQLYTGKSLPKSWADFWDVQHFPGTRILHGGDNGADGPWEFALLADGVAPDKLYPLDIQRAYRSLDRIRPHIRKWWKSGSEPEQLFHDKVAHLGENYEGRATALQQQGMPIDIVWNQGKLAWDYWVIPKGAANTANAQKFIAFAIRAEQQAILARKTGYAPSNAHALQHLTEEQARRLATYPANRDQLFESGADWYAEVGPDGRSNIERLAESWQEWVLK
jgi:putative spermidine/putrescine transport system substrate-binding protein